MAARTQNPQHSRKKQRVVSAAGISLKEYRAEHHLSQEQLASELGIDTRVLRSYEAGERQLTNVNELHRIADRLGIAPEKLGLGQQQPHVKTTEQIHQIVERGWSLVAVSRIEEADQLAKRTLGRIETTDNDAERLRAICELYHLAGYTTSLATHTFEAYRAIPFYKKVREIGAELGDPIAEAIGLTYVGDMHQRMGDSEKSLTHLEAALNTSGIDAATRGNAAQLAARAYIRMSRLGEFERAMAISEELSTQITAQPATRGQYNLGTVYEEYGKQYAQMGMLQKALNYLEKADEALPPTAFWKLLTETARAIALVRGNEIREGVHIAIQAAEQCYTTGNLRLLDRIFGVQQHLERLSREIALIASPLRETLDRTRGE